MLFDSARLRSVAQAYLDAQAAGKDVISARLDYVYEATPGVIVTILDEIKKLRPDAERYQWLREYKAGRAEFRFASLEMHLPVPPRAKDEPPRKFDACFDAGVDAAKNQWSGT